MQSNIKFDILERYEKIYEYLEKKEDKRVDKLMNLVGELMVKIRDNTKE